ncbi:ATP-binding protein [Patescibacteria group bacterium]|nr:MAG: ATP-binding protein [Patescibacteria group bacterium]
MYIKRTLEEVIKNQLFKGKVIILYGPRQSGKTTLVKEIVKDFGTSVRFVDCELLANHDLLTRRNTEEIFSLVRGYKIVVFDEAQTVKGIGSVLKSLFDHYPEIQYISTGSSSFDLINEVSEPLTGRSREYILYPLGLTELTDRAFDAENRLGDFMRFGGYPGLQGETEEEKKIQLNALVSQYLYKNILSIEGFRKPELVVSLLKLLAFQIGHEVSFRELSQTLNASIATVQKYIGLLETNYVIMRIGAYSGNGRKEVVRSKKIFFIDLGLRNALIDNFAPMQSTARPDVGVVFENCMIVERLKHVVHLGHRAPKQFFWRTVDQKEIDYIEERNGRIKAFEFKWGSISAQAPKSFMEHYKNASFETINQKNVYPFLLQEEDL